MNDRQYLLNGIQRLTGDIKKFMKEGEVLLVAMTTNKISDLVDRLQAKEKEREKERPVDPADIEAVAEVLRARDVFVTLPRTVPNTRVQGTLGLLESKRIAVDVIDCLISRGNKAPHTSSDEQIPFVEWYAGLSPQWRKVIEAVADANPGCTLPSPGD